MVGMNMQEPKVALVTGIPGGTAFEAAIILARCGYDTYDSMRNLEKSKNITKMANKEKLPLQIVHLDVNDNESVRDNIQMKNV